MACESQLDTIDDYYIPCSLNEKFLKDRINHFQASVYIKSTNEIIDSFDVELHKYELCQLNRKLLIGGGIVVFVGFGSTITQSKTTATVEIGSENALWEYKDSTPRQFSPPTEERRNEIRNMLVPEYDGKVLQTKLLSVNVNQNVLVDMKTKFIPSYEIPDNLLTANQRSILNHRNVLATCAFFTAGASAANTLFSKKSFDKVPRQTALDDNSMLDETISNEDPLVPQRGNRFALKVALCAVVQLLLMLGRRRPAAYNQHIGAYDVWLR